MSTQLSVVVVAAGRSQRMGFDKMLTPICGRPLIEHTLRGILTSPRVAELVLVVRPDTEDAMRQMTQNLKTSIPVVITHGGAERQDSVMAGLAAGNPSIDHVMIQDAARPFITAELIAMVHDAAIECGAAVCGSPSSDTLKEMGADGVVAKTLDRSRIWAVQTPQIFHRALLAEAYEKVRQSGGIVTDDTAAVEAMGRPVRVVEYRNINFKVTTPADWTMARQMLAIHGSAPGHQIRMHIHDINNQLTALFGYTFLLGMDVPENTKGRRYLEQIDVAGKKCQELMVQIYQLARQIFPKENEKE